MAQSRSLDELYEMEPEELQAIAFKYIFDNMQDVTDRFSIMSARLQKIERLLAEKPQNVTV